MILSRTAKESLKTALALVIAYAIALSMDWDRPYWAGFAVAFVSLSSIGQSLNKAALRMAGTLLAVPMAFLLLALFPQERWLFMLGLSLWVGFCTYMAGVAERQYFWICAGFICALICIDAGPGGVNAFDIAILRAQETGLGILVYSLVASLLWPVRSGQQLDASVQQYMAAEKAFYHATHDQLLGRASAADVQEKLEQGLQAQRQFAALLTAATADTFEVWESKQAWQAFQQQSAAVSRSLSLWRGSLAGLGEVEFRQVVPGLDQAGIKLEQRFSDIQAMLGDAAYAASLSPIELTVDREQARALPPFQQAELAAAAERWRELESGTRQLFQCVAALQGQIEAPEPPAAAPAGKRALVIDIERLGGAISVMAAMWIAYLAWIYVPDLPGGSSVVMMSAPLGMNLALMPQLPVIKMLKPLMLSVLAAGLIYIFIMPQLSTFLGLGLLLFIFTFAVTYLFAAPEQALGKAFGLVLFLAIASISNDQTYSFLVVSTNALVMPILVLILLIAEQIPRSPLPEKNFQRLLARYFRSSEALLAAIGRQATGSAPDRQYARHVYEIQTLPKKLRAWTRVMPPQLLPGGKPTAIADVVTDIEVLSLRLNDLMKADAQALPPPLIEAMAAEFRAWHQEILGIFRRLSKDPGAIDQSSFRAGLDRATVHMEDRIRQILDRPDRIRLNEEQGVDFLQLLAAYRGFAGALAEYAGSATAIDWPSWREERFA